MSKHASKFSILHFRTKLVLIGIFLFAIGSVFSAGGAYAANPSASLDQCANDPLPSPNTDGCDTNANQWVNGNLGASKANYSEGDSIPYRITMQNLSLTPDHHITIEWDTTKSSKHALDYLTTFNRTVTTANPCLGVSGCGAATTFAIPADPQVTGAGVTPVAGNFTMFGGTITSVSAYSYSNGAGFVGDKSASITLTFTPTQANPVLAWGGHIATRQDWGAGNSAVAISGSPYHTRLLNLDGSGGNQDRSLSAEAVIFPASITVIKDAVPNDAQDFGFTATGGTLTPTSFTLDDDADITNSNTQAYTNIKTFTTYTFTEATVSGWTLSFGTPECTVTSANGGTQSGNAGTGVLTINLKEGENVTCTFTNTRQAAKLIVIKHVVNDNGGTAVAGDFTMSVTGGSPSPASFPGAEAGTEVTLTPNTAYAVSETGPSGYAETDVGACFSLTGIPPGGTATCTVTNDDQAATLIVIKHVINDNGGTAVAGDFTLDSGGTNDSPDNFPGDEGGTNVTLDAGSYGVTETGPSGYTESDSADCSGTIANGQTKTCTVTNDDQAATLIVIKHVINDNGGTAVAGDFTMSVTNSANPANFPGDEGGTSLGVNPGAYSVSESGPSGYTESDSADCSGNIALGETKTCTVTNDDIAQHVGQITPTGTTCNQFNNDSATTLDTLKYTVKGGKVNSVAPGVFFYWIKVNVTTTGPQTFTIQQSITSSGNNFNHFFTTASGSFVYDSNCVKVATQSVSSTGVVTFTAPSTGTYIIGVKYDAGSVKGFTAPSPTTTVDYQFEIPTIAGSAQALHFVKG
jgi:hypothetical protein